MKLRGKKVKVIEEIRDLVDELEYVQSQLPEDEQKHIPRIPDMDEEEMPEK